MGYKEVQTWLKTVGESTGKEYLRCFDKFCEWCGKTPKELILERDKEIRNPDPNSRTGIRDLILDFRKYLEKEGYAPKTISSADAVPRSFFTAVLGKQAMINVKNYASVVITKDLVPTLEELKLMIDAVSIEEKIRIIFLAQTGMRVSDALELKLGDIQRELDLNNSPLAVVYTPKKDREMIGERITFLGSDGIDILKQYLKWRETNGEILTLESPLFVGRTKNYGDKKRCRVNYLAMNESVKKSAKKAGIGNGDSKYGRMRVHCLRKFFITQLTNHGVQDKVVDFISCHKLSEVDRSYWCRRDYELREIYREREKFLNPISETQSKRNLEDMEDLQVKIEELENQIKIITVGLVNGNSITPNQMYHTMIVIKEEDIIRFSNEGYNCQVIGNEKWLMKRKL